MMEQSLVANQELFNAINSADEIVQRVWELKNEEETLRNQAQSSLYSARTKRKNLEKAFVTIPLLLSLPTYLFLGLVLETMFKFPLLINIFTKIFETISNMFVLMFGPIYAIAAVWAIISLPVAFLCSFISKFIPCGKQDIENAEIYESMANEKHSELERFILENKDYVAIIAPEFRYPVATHELARIFRLGRAATLPEAYDKLELKLHQMRVEEKLDLIIAGQRAVISLLSKIEYNTRWLDYGCDYEYDYDDF